MYRLSKPQAFWVWIIIVSLSGGVIGWDCIIETDCSAPLLFSLLSISLGFLGTIILALPSIVMRLGRSEEIEQARRFNQNMHAATDRVEKGEMLEEGEDEFSAMLEFIHEHSDFEGEASTISKGSPSGALFHFIAIDGKDTDIKTFDVKSRMKSYVKRMNAAEEWEEEVQERLYVLLGCSVYGLAIIFQALATIILNLDSFNL